MDPDETLARIRRLVLAVATGPDQPLSPAAELAEAVTDLDGWLAGGGFLPTAWDRSRAGIGGGPPG